MMIRTILMLLAPLFSDPALNDGNSNPNLLVLFSSPDGALTTGFEQAMGSSVAPTGQSDVHRAGSTYPQVPLGWRKVTLEWDDGSWMLDFSDY